MFGTMLLLSLCVGQAGADAAYKPKAGDRGVLGQLYRDEEALDGGEEVILRAECFSSLEAAREAAEILFGDERSDAVDPMPDAYYPRAGTAVKVAGIQPLTYIGREGKTVRSRVIKVLVLEGEFKGKTLYTRWSFVMPPADVAPVARRQAAGKRRKSAPGRPAPVKDSKLTLTDLAVEPGVFQRSTVSGRFRSTSALALESVQVHVIVEDADGRMIQSQTWFCQPNAIEPGAIGTFETIVKTDPRAARVRLDFRTFDRAIPWTDKSGKDAHE